MLGFSRPFRAMLSRMEEKLHEGKGERAVEEGWLTYWQLRSMFVTSGNDFVNVGEIE